MRERKQNAMREAELDRLLECGLTDLPPGDVLEDVTPWKRAMNRVLLGMALTGITLNVLCLNYLLPAVGMALLLLGFRALRRENRWFGVCWGITVVRTAYGYGLLVLDTTILRGAFYASPAAVVLPIWLCCWRSASASGADSGRYRRRRGCPPMSAALWR